MHKHTLKNSFCPNVFYSTLLLVALAPECFCQTSGKNYIAVTNVKQQGIKHEASLQELSFSFNGRSQEVSYFDGAGRPVLNVNTRASATQRDIITPVEYDVLGRETKKHIPYTDLTSTDYGGFKTDWSTKQPAFYNGQLAGVQTDASPFMLSVLEQSPLNRLLAQGNPGAVWQPNSADPYDATKKVVKIKYEVNQASENIIIWDVSNTTASFDINQIIRTGFYATGLLSVKHTWDEHGNEIKEYTNKEGQVIFKNIQDGAGTWAGTYYIYDDFSRLRAVIQPEGVNSVPATLDYTFADRWMFLYRYDERGRMVMKKIPGADSIVMMYDRWDRLVLTQDGVQRGKTNKEFLFTKYDHLNRPIATGIYVSNSSHSIIRNSILAATTRFENVNASVPDGYTLNLTFPTTYQELLSLSYYDGYTNLPSWKSGYLFVAENAVTASNGFVLGKPVASQIKVIGTTTWLRSVTYYDEEYRPIQVISDHIKAGKDRVTSKFLWDGKVSEQWQTHTSNFYTAGIVLKKKFTYDHADRLLTVKHQINNDPEITIADNSYNELGQLLSKKLHKSSTWPVELQKLDYGYNIRGWLMNINRVENTAGVTSFEAKDLFAFELGYNTGSLTGTAAQFNGNISEQRWKGPLAEVPIGFTYTYDQLNRLTNSYSHNKSGASWTLDNKYDEKGFEYDKNGNIKRLIRQANGASMDNLTYTYTGNRLTKIEDAGDASLGFKNLVNLTTEYLYDANGSMSRDDNKGISSLTYNYLNLPALVTVTSKGSIAYLYDAAGNKLRKINQDQATGKSDTIWYAGGLVYAKDTVQLIFHDEGRIRPVKINATQVASPTNFKYIYDYFIRDHLGSVRLVATTESSGQIYSATMETANAATEDQLFSNVSSTAVSKPAGFDAVGSNARVSRLHGNINTAGNKRTGPSIILRVMAGDTISASTFAWYSGTVQAPPTGLTPIANELITALTNNIVSLGGGKDGTFSQATIQGLTTTAINSFITNNQSYNTTRPKAFLNWMILDDQFVLTDNSSYRGAVQIPTIAAGGTKQQLVGPVNLVVQKTGYLYVYVSNESDMNVHFDDVVVNHKRGPVVEATNYYSFGHLLSGLSYKSVGPTLNKFRYNGKELQSSEFNDGSGLDEYDYGARFYDPLLGNWNTIDPLAEKSRRWSVYNYCYNNPIKFIDPDGMETQAYGGQSTSEKFDQWYTQFLSKLNNLESENNEGHEVQQIELGNLQSDLIDNSSFKNGLDARENYSQFDEDGPGKKKKKGIKNGGKGNSFRPGKKKQRDPERYNPNYPNEFWEWYHKPQNKKNYKLPGQPDPNIDEVYQEWLGLGNPRFSPQVNPFTLPSSIPSNNSITATKIMDATTNAAITVVFLYAGVKLVEGAIAVASGGTLSWVLIF